MWYRKKLMKNWKYRENYDVICIYIYTGCNRRNGPDFGRVFLMLNYTEKPKTPISKVERFGR